MKIQRMYGSLLYLFAFCLLIFGCFFDKEEEDPPPSILEFIVEPTEVIENNPVTLSLGDARNVTECDLQAIGLFDGNGWLGERKSTYMGTVRQQK